jgi:hypothetical protein
MRTKFEIDDAPVGGDAPTCRWCERTAHWSTTAYARSEWHDSWSNLCHLHVGRLLAKIGLRRIEFERPEPIVRAEADLR